MSAGARRAARTPLVLVPGLLCDALLWQHQVASLGELADCWVGDHTRSATMAQVAADVLAACPFETFALAGLSMGGYVVLEMQRQAPGRVTHLALLDTAARADGDEQRARRQAFIDLADRGRFMGVTDQLLPVLVHADRLADAALVATVKTMARNVGKAAFVRQQHAIMSRIDSRPHLGGIACPTLVLCGREDALTPLDRHEEMASMIPAAELEVVERCGHLSTLERPAEVTRAMRDWLGRA